MMIDFDHFWNEGIVSFDTCSLGRMYEWEYKYSVNIKDALSYLYTTNKLWETSVTIDELKGQRDNIRNNIFDFHLKQGEILLEYFHSLLFFCIFPYCNLNMHK